MNLKNRFINCIVTDNQTSVTIFCENTQKMYTGISKCHPDDTFNNLRGGRLAETRAELAALKEYRKIKKAECEAIRKFVNACTQHKDFDVESTSAKDMFHQLNIRIKEVNDIADEINAKLAWIERFDSTVSSVVAKLEKMKS